MDMDEAKTLIKGLQATGREAEQQRNIKQREAKACRARATKKAALAMSELSDEGSPMSSPSPTYRKGGKGDEEAMRPMDAMEA